MAERRTGPTSLPHERPRFRAALHDGFGEDWLISYKDVAPYYDKVERYVGITGMMEGHGRASRRAIHAAHGEEFGVERDSSSTAKQKLWRTLTLGLPGTNLTWDF